MPIYIDEGLVESHFERNLGILLLGMEEVHIGHYILGRTIGAGGFAKVKGSCWLMQRRGTISLGLK